MFKPGSFKHLAGSALIAAALLTPIQSSAVCCGDGEAVVYGISKATGETLAAIVASTAQIAAVLEQMTMSISTGFGKVVSEIMKQTAAMRVMEEGKIAVQTQLYMQKVVGDAQSKFELSSRSCFETAGGTAAGVAAGETREAVNDLNRSFASRTLYTPNTSAAIGKTYSDHVDKYCSQGDAARGRCTQPAPLRLQNADIRVDAILNVSSYTPQEIEAAQSFVNNVANPIPTQNIPAAWEKTSQGKAFVARQSVEQARLSVAANSLNHAVATRIPVQGLGSSALLNKSDVSELDLMESQVRGRFESPAWYQLIAGFSIENLMREANKMEAFQLYLSLKDLQRWERIETILATQLSLDVNKDADLREARIAAMKVVR